MRVLLEPTEVGLLLTGTESLPSKYKHAAILLPAHFPKQPAERMRYNSTAGVMRESFGEASLEAIAREVVALTRLIVEGQVAPYDAAVQEWATALFVALPNHLDTPPLLEAIEACLVNLLSCDNAP
jgi:hypothetical protein